MDTLDVKPSSLQDLTRFCHLFCEILMRLFRLPRVSVISAVIVLSSFVGSSCISNADDSPRVLSAEQMSSGDRVLSKLRTPAATVWSLWPDSGRRESDPGKELTEDVPQSRDGLVRIKSVAQPTLHLWRSKTPDGRAVIVFPGGGYNGLAAQHEGTEIAEWLNRQGITAFVCKYRVPRREGLAKHQVALEDAQQAIRFVRGNAKMFGIRADQIGVMGFSAGGHLSAMCIHHGGAANRSDEVSARPDFASLIYPAYLTTERDTLDGAPELIPLKSNWPPVFVTVAVDDPFALGSISYTLRLRREKASVELHMYERGGHGKGLQERGYPFSQWTTPAERWLRDLAARK